MFRIFIAWMVAAVAFTAFGLWAFSYSQARWHHNIHQARYVHPGWKIHQATVVSHRSPDLGANPPDVPSRVQFSDYYGHLQQAMLTLPYNSQVGDTTQIDVAADGSIYAPASYNDSYNNPQWFFQGPQKAIMSFWPVWGLVIFGVVDVVIALILGLITFAIADHISVPDVRGRLGTH